MQFCHPQGNVPASLWSDVCFCSPSTTPQAERERRRGERGGWGGGGLAQACSLQLCPYSQHLTRGPDVHTGNSNNLSNVSPLWDPGTCKGNPAIQHDGVITGLISLHLERTHFNRSNQTLPDRGNNTKMVLHAQHFICTSNKSHSALGTDPISHQVATTSHTAAT